jgi:hypothetical protein
MTRRWLAAAALVTALAGCADDEIAPAEIPVPATGPAEASPSAIPAIRAATHAAAVPRATTTKITAAEEMTNAGSGSRGLDGFVADVRSQVPEVAVDRRDEEIEEIAQQACPSLQADKKAAAVVAEVEEMAGVDKATADQLIRLAIETVCPAQHGRADEF